eukprot:341285-Pyramimonas_sp.AAC.1
MDARPRGCSRRRARQRPAHLLPWRRPALQHRLGVGQRRRTATRARYPTGARLTSEATNRA